MRFHVAACLGLFAALAGLTLRAQQPASPPEQPPPGLTADSQLSALAAGDYLVELTFAAGGTTERILTAIRVTR